ncbi:MAG: hypothetical protein IPG06_13625 [Haliea sp.]|nr:hypothetical protein [Haliea sp.]
MNWVTHPLVGMTVEGLRWVNAFRAENPELRIGLLLASDAPIVLTKCLSALDCLYAVDVAASCNSDQLVTEPPLSTDWDYLFTDPRTHAPAAHESFRKVDELLRRQLLNSICNQGWQIDTLPATKHRPIRLALPEAVQKSAAARLPPGRSPVISFLQGSAAEASRTPSMGFWHQLINALRERHPDVCIVLIGSLKAKGKRTMGINRNSIDALLNTFDGMVDAVDLPILEQLALAELCDVHISPHTGMAFAIQCVGTPWMALSGAREVEYVFNGVPFASVYPSCDRYPCGDWVGRTGYRMYPRCEALKQFGKPFDCMSTTALNARMNEILDRVDDLIAGRIDYHMALQQHRKEIARRTDLPDGDNFLEGGEQVMAWDFLY